MASSMYGTSSRLTMKPALSLVGIPALPILSVNSWPVVKASSEVVTARTAGVRRWWAQLLDAFPDFHVEILEVRDLGEFMVLALRLRGRGAESDTPVDAAVWHVNQFRDGKVIRWRVYTSESEALETVGLRE